MPSTGLLNPLNLNDYKFKPKQLTAMEYFKIGVYYSHEGNWKFLPDTSQMLSEKNMMPIHGDRITTIGNDFKIMNLDSIGDFKSVVTVKERIHRYVNCDLALICDYQKW